MRTSLDLEVGPALSPTPPRQLPEIPSIPSLSVLTGRGWPPRPCTTELGMVVFFSHDYLIMGLTNKEKNSHMRISSPRLLQLTVEVTLVM